MTFDELRIKHPQLIYEDFKIEHKNGDLVIDFNFLLTPDIKFEPQVIFPKISQQRLDLLGSSLKTLVFNLGLVELISYWKSACPPEIIIKAGFLSQEQITFWQNLLIQGLGEFYFENKIDFTREDLVEFRIDADVPKFESCSTELKNRDLVLVGGGKDSAVTLDILSRSAQEFNCLGLNPTTSSKKIMEIGGCKNPIVISRIIDPSLLELNRLGYLNGHTPFSAYLAFLSVLVGVLYDYKNIIVSNEASSSEANTEWFGMEVNHQYSKTFEFETLFKYYTQRFLSPYADYFSFLRPLNELQIARLFAQMEKYHLDFRSCNAGSKKGIWCGKCPKCISTYLMLYPFLGEKLSQIFGNDLLEDEDIVPIIEGLLRVNNILKPFECVATVEETKVAIYLGIEYAKSKSLKVPIVLQQLEKYASSNIEILNSWDEENNLPDKYRQLLKERIDETH